MPDEIVRLVTEIDTTQPVSGAAGIDDAFKRTEQSVGDSMRRSGTAVKGLGDEADKTSDRWRTFASHTARVGRLMVGAIGAASSAAAGAERDWIRLGSTILMSFAAGGPVVGGLSLVAAGVGILGSSTKDAAEAAAKYREEMAKALEEQKSKLADVLDAWEKVNAAREDFMKGLPPGTTAEALASSKTEKGLLSDVSVGNYVLALATARRIAKQREVDELRQVDNPVQIHFGESDYEKGLRELATAYREEADAIQRVTAAEEALTKLRETRKAAADLSAMVAAKARSEAETAAADRLDEIREDLARHEAQAGPAGLAEVAAREEEARASLEAMRAEAARVQAEMLAAGAAELDSRDMAAAQERLRQINDEMRQYNEALERAAQAWIDQDAALDSMIRRFRTEARLSGIADPRARRGEELRAAFAEQFASNPLAAGREQEYVDAGLAAFDAAAAAAAAKAGEHAGQSFTTSMGRTISEAEMFWSGVGREIGGAISDSLVDVIMDGGKRVEDIWKSLVRSLLSQTLNSVISSGLGALFGGGGATTGSGLVSSFLPALAGGGACGDGG